MMQTFVGKYNAAIADPLVADQALIVSEVCVIPIDIHEDRLSRMRG